jgi:hypothetical protein
MKDSESLTIQDTCVVGAILRLGRAQSGSLERRVACSRVACSRLACILRVLGYYSAGILFRSVAVAGVVVWCVAVVCRGVWVQRCKVQSRLLKVAGSMSCQGSHHPDVQHIGYSTSGVAAPTLFPSLSTSAAPPRLSRSAPPRLSRSALPSRSTPQDRLLKIAASLVRAHGIRNHVIIRVSLGITWATATARAY